MNIRKIAICVVVLIILLSGCDTIRDLYGTNKEQPVPPKFKIKKTVNQNVRNLIIPSINLELIITIYFVPV